MMWKSLRKLFSLYKMQFILLLGLLMLFKGFRLINSAVKKVIPQVKLPKLTMTKKRLLKLLQDAGLDFDTALIVGSIALHETNNFQSDIYKENNNLFGMKQATKRENTAIGTNREHAVYCCDEDSILDFFLWWNMHGYKPQDLNGKHLHDIISLMKGYGYFEDTQIRYTYAVEKRRDNWMNQEIPV